LKETLLGTALGSRLYILVDSCLASSVFFFWVAKFHPFAKDIFKKENSVTNSLFYKNCQKMTIFFPRFFCQKLP
jgi:hypothetical protein